MVEEFKLIPEVHLPDCLPDRLPDHLPDHLPNYLCCCCAPAGSLFADVVKRKNKGLRSKAEYIVDKSMQTSRATVEDWFGYMTTQFPYFRTKRNFQLLR